MSTLALSLPALSVASPKSPALARAASNQLDVAQLSLGELMVEYAHGSTKAFDEIYERVAPRLLGYLRRLATEPLSAEDLLQATFLRVHRARESYVPGSDALPWFFVIARNVFNDAYRARRARPEGPTYDGKLPELADDHNPEQLLETDSVMRALSSLPHQQREAIELTKLSGLSVGEAAQALGTTPTAVKLRVHRGYETLRKLAWD